MTELQLLRRTVKFARKVEIFVSKIDKNTLLSE